LKEALNITLWGGNTNFPLIYIREKKFLSNGHLGVNYGPRNLWNTKSSKKGLPTSPKGRENFRKPFPKVSKIAHGFVTYKT